MDSISIIIPTANKRPEGLKRCLDSIEKLDYPKELITVQVIVDEPRKGLSARLKEGTDRATGDWVVFASDDVEFTPDCLKNVLKGMKDNNKKYASFNTGDVYPDQGNINEHMIIHKDLIAGLPDKSIFDLRLNHIGTDNVLWARMKKIGQNYRCNEAILKHYHFTKPGGKMDDTYMLAWREDMVKKDRETMKKIMGEEGLV